MMAIDGIADFLTVAGLVLDAFGIVGLFIVAPEKYPDPQSTAFFSIGEHAQERWRKRQKIRKIAARTLMGVVFFGFILQGFAAAMY